jgi:amino acid permease
MIQRKQSIYLLVALLSILLVYFVPFAKLDNGAFQASITIYNIKDSVTGRVGIEQPSNYGVHIGFAVILVLTLVAFISFNNRKRQIAILKLNFVAYAITFALLSFYLTAAQNASVESELKVNIGMFLPTIALVCNFMAMRFIRKDEELVRSVDRIR